MSDLLFTSHKLKETPSGGVHCTVCGKHWKKGPQGSLCPGLPIYDYSDWSHGLMTKNQLNAAGYQIGKKLPPVVGVVPRSKSPDGYLRLYDPSQATPKNQPTEAQLKALEKAKYMAEKVAYHCSKCGQYGREVSRKRYLARKDYYDTWTCEFCADRIEAIQWSQQMLAAGFVIIDTETTGLYGADIIQIGIIDTQGNTILDSLIRTDKEISEGAIRIHGITKETLETAPSFTQLHKFIYDALHAKEVVIYNAGFDWPLIREQSEENHLPEPKPVNVYCAMKMYAQFYGEWSSYFKSYKWQPLTGGDHSALGDCLATLNLIKYMASFSIDEPHKKPSV